MSLWHFCYFRQKRSYLASLHGRAPPAAQEGSSMHHRLTLFAAVSAVSLWAGVAAAQDQAAASVDEVVVTGTRTEGRTRLESLAPVDVISTGALQRQGSTELAQALSTVAPSLDFPRPAITDGTDSVRPA